MKLLRMCATIILSADERSSVQLRDETTSRKRGFYFEVLLVCARMDLRRYLLTDVAVTIQENPTKLFFYDANSIYSKPRH